MQAIAPLLVGGDFYNIEDKSEYRDDPGWDLTIRAFRVAVPAPGGGAGVGLRWEARALAGRPQGDGEPWPQGHPQRLGEVAQDDPVRRVRADRHDQGEEVRAG